MAWEMRYREMRLLPRALWWQHFRTWAPLDLSVAHCSSGVGCGKMIRRARKNIDDFQFCILRIQRKRNFFGKICPFIWLSELASPLIFSVDPKPSTSGRIKNQRLLNTKPVDLNLHLCVKITHWILHGQLLSFPKVPLKRIPDRIQVLPLVHRGSRAQKENRACGEFSSWRSG